MKNYLLVKNLSPVTIPLAINGELSICKNFTPTGGASTRIRRKA